MTIHWDQFTWEAFATLSTGAMAVVAAYAIGRRQTSIAERQVHIAGNQNMILERQVELEELKLRGDLFERRMVVFEEVMHYLGHIVREGRPKPLSDSAPFYSALRHARFLFPVAVYRALDEMRLRAITLQTLRDRMDSTYETEGHYGDGNSEQEQRLLDWFWQQVEEMPVLMGEELTLTLRTNERRPSD